MPDFDCAAMSQQLQANPQLIWAPIRHHSPVCSWQLLALIKQSKPDVILIEAPSDAQPLLQYLQHQDTQPPIALYLYSHFQDQDQGQDKSQSTNSQLLNSQSGFVPLAEMSPEWNALKAAHQRGAECELIDLPYYCQRDQGPQDQHDYLIYDNQRTFQGEYIAHLLAATGCDDFDQWWDRHFEGQYLTACHDFFKQTLLFGLQMRDGSLLTADRTDLQTQYREQYMASRIAPHLKAGKRVLVVCGAYHCLGIDYYLNNPASLETCLLESPQLSSEPRSSLSSGLSSGQYLVPYPLARLSHKSYGASLCNSGYYDKWWRTLKASTVKQRPLLSQQLHGQLATQLMIFLQRKSLAVALPQLVDIVVIAEQLAQLRDIVAGRSEFREAVALALDKAPSTKQDIERFNIWLDEFFCDQRQGTLPASIPCAPIVIEFRQQCIKLKLPYQAIDGQVDKELAIYRNANHRKLSQWLHRLVFLDIPYATQTAGPNFFNQTDLARVREKWSIQWQVEREPA